MRRRYKKSVQWDSDRLNLAFLRFRQAELIARQTFSCCGRCAGAQLASELGEKVTKVWNSKGPVAAKREYDRLQTKVKGVVFYHRQDRAGLEEDGQVYLRFGDVEASDVGTFGMSTVEVGKLITSILTELEITWEWDGSPDECILVDLRTQSQRVLDQQLGIARIPMSSQPPIQTENS